MGFFTRKPTPNDRVGRNDILDKIGLLLANEALRCCRCKAVTTKENLTHIGNHFFCPKCEKTPQCNCVGRCADNIGTFLDTHRFGPDGKIIPKKQKHQDYGGCGGNGEAD